MMFEDRAIIAFYSVAGIFVGLWVCTVNSSLSLNRNWKFNQPPYLEQTVFSRDCRQYFRPEVKLIAYRRACLEQH